MVKRYEVYEGELSEWSGGTPPGNRSVVVMASDYDALEAALKQIAEYQDYDVSALKDIAISALEASDRKAEHE